MVLSVRRWRTSFIIGGTMMFIFYYLLSSSEQLAASPPAPIPVVQVPEPFKHADSLDGKVHWSKRPEAHPVDTLIPLPTGKPNPIPKIQASPAKENDATRTERLERQAAVKESFIHSWSGYKEHAWLRDEVAPITGGYRNTFGGWAATLVDSMDTLWLMGLKDDFELCVRALDEIDFTTTDSKDINVFETTIRYMGGFLAAYDLSEGRYPTLLTKAIEVGEMLMSVFDTPNRMPITRWDWKKYIAGKAQEAPASQLVAEPMSLSLEFTRLAQLTGDNKYYDAIQRVANEFEKAQMKTPLPGMWPVMINPQRLKFDSNSVYTLGGMADSLYEYLPKQYMIMGGLLDQPRTMYENFIEVAKKHLFLKALNPGNLDLIIPGDVKITPRSKQTISRGQHLTCFAGGMVAIASKIFERPEELHIGEAITNGCVWAYDSMNHTTSIGPEIFDFATCDPIADPLCEWDEEKWFKQIKHYGNGRREPNSGRHQTPQDLVAKNRLPPGFTSISDKRYILRPEAIESVFVMYRVTGDKEWQDKAWRMFEAIRKVSRTDIAATGIWDVTDPNSDRTDSMESFWLGETLKYFYLIFSEPSLMSLDEFVLNTEAHPLRRPL